MDGTGDDADDSGPDHGALAATASVVGKKWHPLIVAELLEAGPLGFNELKTRVDGISDKVQSESLDDLQTRGIVERTVIDDKPVRVEYSLTPLGERLEDVLATMRTWGDRYRRHDDGADVPDAVADCSRVDPETGGDADAETESESD